MRQIPQMYLYDGSIINPMDPFTWIETISIDHVAESLSYINRFAGSCKSYSVAEHALNGANYFIRKDMFIEAFLFLHHDNAEMFLGDIPSFSKKQSNDIYEVENFYEKNLFPILGIPFNTPGTKDAWERVKALDKRICKNEIAEFFGSGDKEKIISAIEPHKEKVKQEFIRLDRSLRIILKDKLHA